MPPAEFPPPYSQTLTGNFESLVAFSGAQTSINKLQDLVREGKHLKRTREQARDVPIFGLARLVRDESNGKLWARRGGRGGITDTREGLVVGLRRRKAKIADRRDGIGDREKVVHGGGRASPAAKGAVGDVDLGRWMPGGGHSQAGTEEHSKRLQDPHG